MEIIKPDVFHIGIPKAGSTSIQNLLNNDKRIIITRSRFYTSKQWWENHKIINETGKVVIESNETLISGGFQKVKFSQVVERLYKINSKAKIIIVIRNQPEAIMSMYKYHIKNAFYGTKNFKNWLLETDLGIDYLSLCFYNNILNIILAYFPKEQIKVLLFEELKSNPINFYNKLYEVLGLSLESNNFPKSNVNTYNDRQLYTLTLLNYLSFNKKKSENPYYSSFGHKMEQKIKKVIVRRLSIKQKEGFFSWSGIDSKENIFKDFRYSNKKLIDFKFVDEDDLIKYKYLLPEK